MARRRGTEPGRPRASHRSPWPDSAPRHSRSPSLRDFDRVDGRSRLDSRWINTYEGGSDLSRALFQRIARSSGNYALSIQAQMSESSKPRVHMTLPLRPGGIEPMDFTGARNIDFEARGDGLAYDLFLPTRAKREAKAAPFTPGPSWKKFKISLDALGCPCADATALTFALARPAGVRTWLELDNIRVTR